MTIKIREFIKHIWHDPVLSKVIAGLILGAPIYYFRKTIWPFLGKSIHIQVWLFMILCTLSICLFLIIARYIKIKLLSNNKISESEKFKEEIDGLIWKGQYWKSTCKVDQLSAFCPGCDLELNSPKLVYNGLGFMTGKEYICEHCNKRLLYVEQNIIYDSFVKREIEKRLRNKIKS